MIFFYQNKASFDSMEDFEIYAKNFADIVMWSDFERVNETHFWSRQRNSFIKPKCRNHLRNRYIRTITNLIATTTES